MHGIDLAAEMAAARQRRMEQTARALRDARVLAVRAAARPGATREEVEDMARSFYPRLNDEQIAEVTTMVWGTERAVPAAPAEEDEHALEAIELTDETAVEEEASEQA